MKKNRLLALCILMLALCLSVFTAAAYAETKTLTKTYIQDQSIQNLTTAKLKGESPDEAAKLTAESDLQQPEKPEFKFNGETILMGLTAVAGIFALTGIFALIIRTSQRLIDQRDQKRKNEAKENKGE